MILPLPCLSSGEVNLSRVEACQQEEMATNALMEAIEGPKPVPIHPRSLHQRTLLCRSGADLGTNEGREPFTV